MNKILLTAFAVFLTVMLSTHLPVHVGSIIPKVSAAGSIVTGLVGGIPADTTVKAYDMFKSVPVSDALVLRVASHSFPPYQYKKNGKIEGPVPKIMAKVCARARISCVIEMGPYREAADMVAAGEADVIFTFLIEVADDERNANFLSSPPIAIAHYSFFTSSTSNWKWTGNPADLEGRTIAAYGPSGTFLVASNVVAQNPTAVLVREDSNLKVFQNLVLGKYGQKAAIIANKEVGLSFLKNSNISGPKPVGDIMQANFGFGFSKKSPRLHYAEAMFKALNELKSEGEVARILTTADEPLVPSP